MNKPMIENSDRGITLNKSLAWTVLVGVLSGGVWVGIQVNSARQGVDALTTRQQEDRLDIRKNTSDITAIRSNNARLDQRLTGIEQSARRTEETVAEILRYLRDGR